MWPSVGGNLGNSQPFIDKIFLGIMPESILIFTWGIKRTKEQRKESRLLVANLMMS